MTAQVNFDFGAAQNVLSEIDNTTSLLRQQKGDRWAQGQSIRTTWKGPYAVKFDGDRTGSDSDAQTVLDGLAALKSKVQSGIDLARAAQRTGH